MRFGGEVFGRRAFVTMISAILILLAGGVESQAQLDWPGGGSSFVFEPFGQSRKCGEGSRGRKAGPSLRSG